MLLKQRTLQGIADGRVTLAFRRWRRPTVRAGGTLLTSIGQLAIDAVDPVPVADLTDADAVAAGLGDREALVAALSRKKAGDVYRVRLHLAGPDPRVALRSELPGEIELAEIRVRLERWDGASPVGPWTRATLAAISHAPEVRAGDLAERMGMEKARFKANVRKLKGLGLTESLERGYRLSPRGEAVLEDLGRAD